jgi:hypothetical protein
MIGWLPFKDADTDHMNNVYSLSSCNALLWSASTSENLEFEVPCIMPMPALDLEAYSAENAYFFQLVIMVLNPLVVLGQTTTQEIVLSLYAEAVNPIAYQPTLYAQSSEAVNKSEKGVISGIAESTATVAGLLNKTPLANPILPIVEKAANMVATVAKSLGFTRPISLQAAQPVIEYTSSSFANGKGLLTNPVIQLDPAAQIANDPDIFGQVQDEMDPRVIARRPGLFFTGDFQPSTFDPQDVITSFHVTPATAYMVDDGTNYLMTPTPMCNVGLLFTYWTGTLQYYIVFECPKMMSFTVGISWLPDVAAHSDVPTGDVPKLIKQVTGRTVIPFSVPGNMNVPARLVEYPNIKTEYGCNGQIYITMESSPIVASGTGTTTIALNIFAAAGPDIAFYVPCTREAGITLTRPSIPIDGSLVAQSSTNVPESFPTAEYLDVLFQHEFPPIVAARSLAIKGVMNNDECVHLSDLAHRFKLLKTITATYGTEYSANELFTASGFPYDDSWFSMSYMYCRPAWDYKMQQSPGAPDKYFVVDIRRVMPVSTSVGTKFGFGGAHTEDTRSKKIVEYSVPYTHMFSFVPTTSYPGNQFRPMGDAKFTCYGWNADANITLRIWRAASDGAIWGHYKSMPAWSVLKSAIPALETPASGGYSIGAGKIKYDFSAKAKSEELPSETKTLPDDQTLEKKVITKKPAATGG